MPRYDSSGEPGLVVCLPVGLCVLPAQVASQCGFAVSFTSQVLHFLCATFPTCASSHGLMLCRGEEGHRGSGSLGP